MTNIVGTISADRLQGTAAGNSISGLAGDDQIEGLDGNDRILGGDGLDTIDGGAGKDFILGGRDSDQLNGGAGDDVLQGGDDVDGIEGDAGNDRLYGADGDDGIDGGAGDDRLFGGGGNDVLSGNVTSGDRSGGHDLLYGGPGRDIFYAERDEDVAQTGVQNDVIMDFDANNDTVAIEVTYFAVDEPFHFILTSDDFDSNGNGVLDDGDQTVAVRQVTADGSTKLSTILDIGASRGDVPGAEILTLHGVTGLTASAFDGDRFSGLGLEGTDGNDRLIGTAFDDMLDGNDGDDLLSAGSGDDRLSGGNGADRLIGGTGQDLLFGTEDEATPVSGSSDDRLSGGAGDDELFGSFGHDVLTGGAGRDNFGVIGVGAVLDDGSKPTVDVLLTDFVRGEDVLNGQTISFDKYDVNGDGQIKGSDPYVTLKQVTYGGETAISLVINLHADDATVATGKLTLFGVTGLDQSDFTSASYV